MINKINKNSANRWILNWLRVHINKSIDKLNMNRSIVDYINDSIMQIKFIHDAQRVFGIEPVAFEKELKRDLYSLHDFIAANRKTKKERQRRHKVPSNLFNNWQVLLSKASKKIGRFLIDLGGKIYIRIKIEGCENLKTGQTYILIANHSSHLDSLALFYSLTQVKITFLAASDYFFTTPFKRFFYKAFLPILPLTREGTNIRDFKNVINYLQNGYSVVIYPEGTRSTTGEMGHFKPGAALLSLQSNIPVVPIYINGAYRLWPKGQFFAKPGKMSIKVGIPIQAPEHKRINEELLKTLTSEYENAVKALK